MWTEHFTFQKHHLGWLLLIGGMVGLVGAFAIDVIYILRTSGLASLFSSSTLEYLRSPMGIGPAQRMAIAGCIAAALVGATLLPLKNHPA